MRSACKHGRFLELSLRNRRIVESEVVDGRVFPFAEGREEDDGGRMVDPVE